MMIALLEVLECIKRYEITCTTKEKNKTERYSCDSKYERNGRKREIVYCRREKRDSLGNDRAPNPSLFYPYPCRQYSTSLRG